MSSIDMQEQATAAREAAREVYYAYLIAYRRGQGNEDALARMYASWVVGQSALPDTWGLSRATYARLMRYHFPGCDYSRYRGLNSNGNIVRSQEQAELTDLMKKHRTGWSPSELWIASIVATACLGSRHLWQDLGLWCREDLSALMQRNFPALAAKNIHDMKWKKFLYKQLCIAEGIYVCRSPSCEACSDYADCFGPED